jgi:hypothetical protein
MEVIEGGYRKGLWFHDRNSLTQEEIDFANEAFREAGQHDARWLKLIWYIKVDSKPELRRVKGWKLLRAHLKKVNGNPTGTPFPMNTSKLGTTGWGS